MISSSKVRQIIEKKDVLSVIIVKDRTEESTFSLLIIERYNRVYIQNELKLVL